VNLFVGGLCLILFTYFVVPYIYEKWVRICLKKNSGKYNTLALTFDDGPGSKLTPAVLEILKEYDAKATFFLLGRNIAQREPIVRQIKASGHEICSHGYDHLNHWRVSPIRAISDIKRGWQAINRVLGQRQGKYAFRPPYGKLNLFTLLYLGFHKVPIYYWTIDIGDTRPEPKRAMMKRRYIDKAGAAIILVHDFDRESSDVDGMILDIVRDILSTAHTKGIRTLTISELLADKKED